MAIQQHNYEVTNTFSSSESAAACREVLRVTYEPFEAERYLHERADMIANDPAMQVRLGLVTPETADTIAVQATTGNGHIGGPLNRPLVLNNGLYGERSYKVTFKGRQETYSTYECEEAPRPDTWFYNGFEWTQLSTNDKAYDTTYDIERGVVCQDMVWHDSQGRPVTFRREEMISQVRDQVGASRWSVSLGYELPAGSHIQFAIGFDKRELPPHIEETKPPAAPKGIITYEGYSVPGRELVKACIRTDLSAASDKAICKTETVDSGELKGYQLLTVQRPVADETYTLNEAFSVHTALDVNGGKPTAVRQAAYSELGALPSVDVLFDEQATRMRQIWLGIYHAIWGNEEAQNDHQGVLFNMYHGMQLVGRNAVMPKGHHKSYGGNIFAFDISMLSPAYSHLQPQKAEKILQYFYRQLATAKEYAQRTGFRGARFGWQLAKQGVAEATPKLHVNPDKTVGEVQTGIAKHHQTADIVHMFYWHHRLTGRLKETHGGEMIAQAALYYLSKVEKDNLAKWQRQADIGDFTALPPETRLDFYGLGPDEWHEYSANFQKAADLYKIYAQHPDLFTGLGFTFYRHQAFDNDQSAINDDGINMHYAVQLHHFVEKTPLLAKQLFDDYGFTLDRQVGVKNNVYDLGMVRMTLQHAVDVMVMFESDPEYLEAVGLPSSLRPQLEAAIARLEDGLNPDNNQLEQFTGHSALLTFPLESVFPEKAHEIEGEWNLKLQEIHACPSFYNLSKQSDATLMLLNTDAPLDVVLANFSRLARQVKHGSWVSGHPEAILAHRIGDIGLAKTYFHMVLNRLVQPSDRLKRGASAVATLATWLIAKQFAGIEVENHRTINIAFHGLPAGYQGISNGFQVNGHSIFFTRADGKMTVDVPHLNTVLFAQIGGNTVKIDQPGRYTIHMAGGDRLPNVEAT